MNDHFDRFHWKVFFFSKIAGKLNYFDEFLRFDEHWSNKALLRYFRSEALRAFDDFPLEFKWTIAFESKFIQNFGLFALLSLLDLENFR